MVILVDEAAEDACADYAAAVVVRYRQRRGDRVGRSLIAAWWGRC
jgi:hypothetical protein